jgi:hypothetical protein
MTFLEKRAWTMLVVAVLAYAAYAVVVLRRLGGGVSLPDVPYAGALLWSVGGAIVANIAVEVALAALRPRDPRTTDVRDADIGRLGDQVGQAFLVIGAVTALLLALAEQHPFWIANAIYLGFALSAVVGSVAKVVMYRKGLPW